MSQAGLESLQLSPREGGGSGHRRCRRSDQLFLALLFELLPQVHIRNGPPVGPGVPQSVKPPSCVPVVRPGRRGAARGPFATPACLRMHPPLAPCPMEDPQRGCWRWPWPPGPRPGKSSCKRARAGPVPASGPASPHVWAAALGSGVRPAAASWAGGPRGRGINGLPQAGPLLRKGMEPSSDQWGHRDLPTCPGCLARPSLVLPSRPDRKSVV